MNIEVTPFPKWRGPRNAAAQMDEVELQAWQSRAMYSDLREYMARRFPNARNVVMAEVLLTLGAQAAALAGVKADEVWTYADEAMAAGAPAEAAPRPKPTPRPPGPMVKLVSVTASTGETFKSFADAVAWVRDNVNARVSDANIRRAVREGRVAYGRTWSAEYE